MYDDGRSQVEEKLGWKAWQNEYASGLSLNFKSCQTYLPSCYLFFLCVCRNLIIFNEPICLWVQLYMNMKLSIWFVYYSRAAVQSGRTFLYYSTAFSDRGACRPPKGRFFYRFGRQSLAQGSLICALCPFFSIACCDAQQLKKQTWVWYDFFLEPAYVVIMNPGTNFTPHSSRSVISDTPRPFPTSSTRSDPTAARNVMI